MSEVIGFRIRELRKKMRFTQKQLADKVAVSPQVVSNWERGYTEPSADDISCLSEVLECPGDYLLGKNVDIFVNGKKVISKGERDIAKRMAELRADLSSATGLLFDGEPMSDEAIESLLEAMEFGVRTAKKVNKKYTPKKHMGDEKD